MKLLKYNNKKVELMTKEGLKLEGLAYFEDADTAESNEDILTINTTQNGYREYIVIFESQIKSIEILD